MNYDLVWSKVLSKIQEEVTSVLYKTWFQETRLYKVEDNIATIIVPSEIHEKFLSERYQELLVGALGQVTNTIYELSFTLKDKVNDIEKISTPIVEKKEVEPSSNYKYASNLIKSLFQSPEKSKELFILEVSSAKLTMLSLFISIPLHILFLLFKHYNII